MLENYKINGKRLEHKNKVIQTDIKREQDKQKAKVRLPGN